MTNAAIRAALAEGGTIAGAARILGVPRKTLSDRVERDGLRDAAPARKDPRETQVSVQVCGDEATITGPTASTVEALIRDNGLDPAEWLVISATLNQWDGPVAGGGVEPLRQVKVTLRRRPEHVFPQPVEVSHVPVHGTRKAPVSLRKRKPNTDLPRLILVEGDHQAPYHDEGLDAAVTAMTRDLQPDEHVFLGDGADFPTISRHPDHPAAMATVKDCLEAYYGILERRAEAAPDARRRKLKGNHDWRLESELLGRAERMYGITPVGEEIPSLSLRRLLHFDRLGIELVEDPRGYNHAEVELVPGEHGLVVRHGWLTGANTAERSMKKRGRSLLVGHTHSREHFYCWDPSAGIERQAAVLGTMSLARSQRFPHFAVCDNWLQGCATVTVWPSGAFQIEHARWHDGALYWRDRRWA